MQELLRTNLATQMAVFKEIRHNRQKLVEKMHQGETVNVDGYGLSCAMYEEACGIDLSSGERTFAGPTLVIQIGRQGAPPNARLQQLCGTYRNGELQSVVEEPFWKEIKRYYAGADNLYEATRNWLQKEINA